MTDKQANTSLYLPRRLKDKLIKRAHKDRVHISTIIREALEGYLGNM